MPSIETDFDRLALLDEERWTANKHYHDFLLKHVPQNCENALEIGCGTGAFARLLAKRSRRVIALDLSPEMIRVARSRSNDFDNLDFQLADAMTWKCPESQLDYVCSIASFHYLNQPKILRKIKEALKPRGVLVVLDLVQSNTFFERALDVAAQGVAVALRLVHNGRLRPPAEVRKAWEQHRKQDSYTTVNEIRTLADEILPGSSVRRHLLWRYSLVYQKPRFGRSEL